MDADAARESEALHKGHDDVMLGLDSLSVSGRDSNDGNIVKAQISFVSSQTVLSIRSQYDSSFHSSAAPAVHFEVDHGMVSATPSPHFQESIKDRIQVLAASIARLQSGIIPRATDFFQSEFFEFQNSKTRNANAVQPRTRRSSSLPIGTFRDTNNRPAAGKRSNVDIIGTLQSSISLLQISASENDQEHSTVVSRAAPVLEVSGLDSRTGAILRKGSVGYLPRKASGRGTAVGDSDFATATRRLRTSCYNEVQRVRSAARRKSVL